MRPHGARGGQPTPGPADEMIVNLALVACGFVLGVMVAVNTLC